MGNAGDTGHPPHPYMERCTRPPNVIGSSSLPSTQSDSILETREAPQLIYGTRMYTIQSPLDHDLSQHTRDTAPSFTTGRGLCVCTQDIPYTQLAAQSDVPDTHTLPQPPSTISLHGLDSPKPKSECLSPFLEYGLPHGHPVSVSPLWQVCPSVGGCNGHLQPPGIFPAAAAGMSPAYCPAGP